jgi:hypothetical protein
MQKHRDEVILKKLMVFESVHYTIKAEKLIFEEIKDIKVIPVPSYISNDCGMCIEFSDEMTETIEVILKPTNMSYKIYDKK